MISIVLLTKNGGHLLQQVVLALQTQVVTDTVEIIALDSGSTDGTVDYLRSAGAAVYEIHEKDFNFGTSRQLAFTKTHGDIIVTLSQDVLPCNQDYLQTLIEPLLCGEADVISGATKPFDASTNDSFYWERCGTFYFTRETRQFRMQHRNMLSCTSMAITRQAWLATGFGNAPFCEDKYIQLRLESAGFRIKTLRPATAWHEHNYSLLTLAKRCHNEGVGWAYAGIAYNLFDFLYDSLIAPFPYISLFIRGLIEGKINTLASLLFFQIRPLFLLIGNRITRSYWR